MVRRSELHYAPHGSVGTIMDFVYGYLKVAIKLFFRPRRAFVCDAAEEPDPPGPGHGAPAAPGDGPPPAAAATIVAVACLSGGDVNYGKKKRTR